MTMWRLKRVCILALAVALTACASLSFDQRLAAAYATNTALRETAAAALNAGTIAGDEGIAVREMTDQIRVLLDSAAAGDERNLQLAIELLSDLEGYLDD